MSMVLVFPRILVIGGDGRLRRVAVPGAAIEASQGSQHGGNGRFRSALSQIDQGSFDFVVLAIKWLGHADSNAIAVACEKAGVPAVSVYGSVSAIKRVITSLLGGH